MRRCADKGSFAVAFSENPVRLKLPSIFTDHWDPFFAACEESDTVVNLHIGSSSTFPMTSLDAPRAVSLALTYQGAAHALSDWLTSGVLDRFPRLKVALSEGQVGWIPFIVERLDSVWHDRPVYGNLEDRLTEATERATSPGGSTAACSTMSSGSKLRDEIGIEQIMFETDYPHGDSTWPHSRAVAEKLVAEAGLDERETYLLTRGNAIECYGLHRFGITSLRKANSCSICSSPAATSSTAPARARRRPTSACATAASSPIGATDEPARRTIDADGRVVTPGLRRRAHPPRRPGVLGPDLSPSPLHGVTTVIAGNCGFTHRAARPTDAGALPHADAGQGRGHAAAVAARRRAVELAHDRRVPRRPRRPPRASTPGSWSGTRRSGVS